MGVRTRQQKITATHQFNGAAPTTTPTVGHELEKDYPTDVVGGLFDFGLTGPAMLMQIELVLDGNTSSWSVSKIDADGDAAVIAKGTNETSFFSGPNNRVLLLAGQKLKVLTAGATAALKARMTVQDGIF